MKTKRTNQIKTDNKQKAYKQTRTNRGKNTHKKMGAGKTSNTKKNGKSFGGKCKKGEKNVYRTKNTFEKIIHDEREYKRKQKLKENKEKRKVGRVSSMKRDSEKKNNMEKQK